MEMIILGCNIGELIRMLLRGVNAAAAAKSLQSCPNLCNLIDSSPPGSTIPRILQARTQEWVNYMLLMLRTVPGTRCCAVLSRLVMSNSLRPHGL